MPAELVKVTNVFDPGGSREVSEVRAGQLVRDLGCDPQEFAISRNGHLIEDEEIAYACVEEGDCLVAVRRLRDPVTIGTTILVALGKLTTAAGLGTLGTVTATGAFITGAVAITGISYGISQLVGVLVGAPALQRNTGSATYTGDLGLLTRRTAGHPIPIVCGKHKAAGQIIYRVTGHRFGTVVGRQPGRGLFVQGFSQLLLVAFSEGPVKSIGGVTTDVDQQWWSATLGAPQTIVQAKDGPITGSLALRDAAARTKISFWFITTADTVLTSVVMKMRHVGNISAGKKITVGIQKGSGTPDGVYLQTPVDVPIDSNILRSPTSPFWMDVTASLNVPILANTFYSVVLEGDYSIDGSNYIDISKVAAPGAPLSQFNGVTWSSLSALAGVNVVADPEVWTGSDINIDGNDLRGSAGRGNISIRRGNGFQQPVPNVSRTFHEQTLAFTLQKGQWFEATTVNEVVGFACVLFFPQGHFTQARTTTASANTVIKIEWRVTGSATWQATHQDGISFGDLSRTGASIRVDFRQFGQFAQFIGAQIDVRLKLDSTTSLAPIQWVGLREMTDDQAQSFPFIAYAAIDTDVQSAQGQSENVVALVEGRKWWVSSGGGTSWNYQYTANPSWIILGLMLNQRIGAGNLLTLDYFDIPSFEAAAAYCDETVPDGEGGTGTIRRHEFNGVLDERKPLRDWADQIATVARLKLIQVGQKFRLKIEKARSHTQIFSPGNIVEGTFEVEYMSKAKRPNAIDIQFLNADLDYNQDVATHEDEGALAAGETTRKETVTLYGETSWIRAKRQAVYYLNLARKIDTAIRFESYIEAVAIEPGDVIGISSDVFADTVGGRVPEDGPPGGVSLKLDRDVTLEAGKSYRITVRTHGTGADVLQARDVTSSSGTYPAGTLIDVGTSFNGSDLPKKGDPYSIGDAAATTDGLRLFTVTDVELTKDWTVRISGLNYDATVFNDDPGKPRPSLINRTGAPPPMTGTEIPPDPAALSLGMPVLSGRTATLTATWTFAPWPFPYSWKVWGRIDSIGQTRYTPLGVTPVASLTITNIPVGHTYTVAVTPMAPATGLHRNPNAADTPTATRTITAPPRPQSLVSLNL